MELTRRNALALGAGAAVAALIPFQVSAAVGADDAIAAFTGCAPSRGGFGRGVFGLDFSQFRNSGIANGRF